MKGGLIVDIGLRGFLPASLVELRRVRELQPYVGQGASRPRSSSSTRTATTSCSRGVRGSRRPRRSSAATSSSNLKPGERRKGVVSSVVNFGAFVDLGGMDGLVHVSELSWKHVDHPSSVVSVGDEVDVQVLDVDLDKERISLSLKATQSDPWQEFADGHQVGELVYGRITKLVPFGAFVQVGDGIEGLVHISEMAAHHVDLPEQVVTPGEELWVKIIDIDLQRRRISLSIKQAAEGGEVAEEYREAFGEHAYDDEGNYIGFDYAEGEFTPETEAQAAWADFASEVGTPVHLPEDGADTVGVGDAAPAGDSAEPVEGGAGETVAAEAPAAGAATEGAAESGRPAGPVCCARATGEHMDDTRAGELLRAERDRVEGLLRDLTTARDEEHDTVVAETGDIADPAEPLTDVEGDDAVSEGLRARLAAIDRAEARLAAGSYGRSVRSGAPIPDDRLEADPAAELTVAEQAAADLTADETIAQSTLEEAEADEEALSASDAACARPRRTMASAAVERRRRARGRSAPLTPGPS